MLEFGTLVFAGLLLYIVLSQQVYRSVDEELSVQAQSVVRELEKSPFYFWSGHLNSFANHYRGTVNLVGANGLMLYTSSDKILIGRGGDEVSKALAKAMKDNQPAFASTQSLLRKDNVRVLATPVHRAGRTVAILLLSRSTGEIQGFFKQLYLIGGILGLISMLISAVAGYLMAKRALTPIHEITSTARAVASGDLSRRLTSDAQDKEIRVLVRALNKMFEDLEASFQSQKRFTADASHELRLPLTIMKGEIEVALRRKRRASEYEQVLRQQLGIIERIERIVNDLLTLARADAGQLELIQEEIDLSLLLQEAGQHHLALFASNDIHLDMDIDDSLTVMGDASHIERVIFNLLNNAFKHAPAHSAIHLSAHVDEGDVLICVRDEGPGIDEQHQQHLFDRFFRADDARCRREGEGAGLGLAICKRIVTAHQGDIWVESTPGKGASFYVRLPLSKADAGHIERLNNLLHVPE